MNPLLSASLFHSHIFGLWLFICRVLVGDQQIVLMWNQECWLSKQSLSRDLVHRVFLGARKHEFCQPGLAIIFIPAMQLCQQIFPQNISAPKWPGSPEGGPLPSWLEFGLFLHVQTWQVLWWIPIYWVPPKHWLAVQSVTFVKVPWWTSVNRFFYPQWTRVANNSLCHISHVHHLWCCKHFPLPPCWALYLRLGIGHFENRSLKDFCTARPRFLEEWEVLKQRCHLLGATLYKNIS